jgi:hypothetical protein
MFVLFVIMNVSIFEYNVFYFVQPGEVYIFSQGELNFEHENSDTCKLYLTSYLTIWYTITTSVSILTYIASLTEYVNSSFISLLYYSQTQYVGDVRETSLEQKLKRKFRESKSKTLQMSVQSAVGLSVSTSTYN